MTRISWDERNFESGVDRGVFYPKNGIGYAWTGIVGIDETTQDASQTVIYIDGVGRQNHLLTGNFAASVEAVTYPEEFEPYDGYDGIHSAQKRRRFDFSYRTMQADGHYKIHLVYNALAVPTQRNHTSLANTVEVELYSWEFLTRPEVVPYAKASSHFVIDTKFVNPGALAAIEDRIYGSEASEPGLPSVIDLLAIFEEFAVFKVTSLGDGMWSISGPGNSVEEIEPSVWRLEWPSVIQTSEHEYTISSL